MKIPKAITIFKNNHSTRITAIILIISLVITSLPSFAYNILNADTKVNASAVKVVCELENKRDKFTKVFLQTDGSEVAITSAQAQNYKKNGKWEDIDSTLVTSTDSTGEEVYTNTKNGYKVSLPKQLDQNKPIVIEKDGFKLSFSLRGTNVTKATKKNNTVKQDEKSEAKKLSELETKSSEVEYRNAKSNSDIKYQIKPEELKEEIIVKSKPSTALSFVYDIKSNSLKGLIKEDNSICFYSEENATEPVFIIPAPFMYDLDNITSHEISVSFTETSKGSFILTYIPLITWMTATDRKYPVIIDPVVKTSLTADDVDDAETRQNYSSLNYSTSGFMYTGNASNYNRNAYLKFNNLPILNSGDVLISAKTFLYNIDNTVDGCVSVYKVTSDWVESAITWDNAPTPAPEVADYQKVSDASTVNSFVAFDITKLAKEWYSTGDNDGMLIKKNTTISTDVSIFSTSESATSTQRPYMEITYRNTIGLESKWDYSTQDGGRAGMAYVNEFSGNLTVVRGDIGYDGNRRPVAVNMIYNSHNRNDNYGYGCGWDVNYRQSITSINNGEYYKYKDGDGTAHYIMNTGTTESPFWEDEDGLGLTLEIFTTSQSELGEFYTITDGSNSILLFKANGMLCGIRDYTPTTTPTPTSNVSPTISTTPTPTPTPSPSPTPSPTPSTTPSTSPTPTPTPIPTPVISEIEIKYVTGTEKIDEIFDGVDRWYKFNYNTSTPYNLSSIEYYGIGSSILKTVSYTYINSGNDLSEVEFSDNKTVNYTYTNTTSNLIASINDVNNSKIKYTYTTGTSYYCPPKVNHIAFFGDNSTITTDGSKNLYNNIYFTYEYNQTAINTPIKADSYDTETIYKQFNNEGETISQYLRDGSAAFGKYGDTGTNGGSSNKLTAVSYMQQSSYNMLCNPDFENTTNFGYTGTAINGGTAALDYADDTVKHKGNQSLSINKESNTGSFCVSQAPTDLPDAFSYYNLPLTLEFSAWVKTTGFNNSDEGVWLNMEYQGALYDDAKIDSKHIIGNSDWQKISIELQLPICEDWVSSDPVFRLYCGDQGTVYFDDMYVGLKRLGDSQNQIETSDFRTGGTISPWIIDNCNGSDVIVNSTSFSNWTIFDPASYKITGEETEEKRIFQTVDLSGKKGDTFTVASFAQAIAVPLTVSNPPSSTDRDFAIKVKVKVPSTDTTTEEKTYRFPFNADTTTWQYLADTFTTEYVYDGIEVSLVYNNQQNYALFDAVQLYKSDYSVKYAYDNNGNLISAKDYTGAEQITGSEESGDSESVTEDGNTGGFENDIFKGMKVSYSPEKVGSASENDIYGNVLTEYTTDGRVGIKGAYSYDSNGNYLDKITDSLGNVTDYNYNTNYGTLDTVVDANENTTHYNYESTGRLETVSKDVSGLYSGSAVSLDYEYVTEERLSSITQNDFAYNFNYDHVGNLRGVSAGNQSIIDYNYSEQSGTNIGNLMTGIDYGNGQSVSYRESHNQIDALKIDGETDWRYYFNYGVNGNISSILDTINDLSTKFSYNTAINQFLTTETGINGKNYYHSYGSFNDTANSSNALIETINGDSYRTDFKTDKDGRLNETYFNYGTNNVDKGSKDVRYDSLGRVQSTNVTKTTEEVNSLLFSTMFNYKEMPDYNTTGQVYAMNIMGGGSTRFDWQYFYTYDKLGNIKTQSKNGVTKFTYTYNELSQLTRVDDLDGNASWKYVYDKGGNIKSKTSYAYTTGTLGQAGPTIYYVYDNTWKDKLTSYNGDSVASDDIGNITELDDRTFTWQGGNQLASTSKTGELSTNYKYNYSGFRTQKTVGSVTTDYTLIGDRVTFETNGTDEIYYRYDGNNELISMNLNDTEYFYVRNLQNDIIALLDSNGNVKVEYSYDSWGKPTGITTDTSGVSLATKNPYRYRGYRYDAETELYYVTSRYYSPELCRFMSADDTSILLATQGDLLGANLFAYCYNNPVMNSDPSGYAPSIGASPSCPNGVMTAIRLTNWDKRFNLNYYSFMNKIGIYQVYTFTHLTSNYHFYQYNVKMIVNSYTGWLKYLANKYSWIAKFKAEIEYGLGILGSVPTIPPIISGPAAVVSYLSAKFPAYVPNEARYIMKMLLNYKETNNSIFIAYSLDVVSVSAQQKYWLWGPITGWSRYYFYDYCKAY